MTDTDTDTAAARRRAKARERQRRYRARKKAEREQAAQRETVVRELRPIEGGAQGQAWAGTVVDAVSSELEHLDAATRQPGNAAAALRMAAILDDPTATPQAATAARVLKELMAGLRETGSRSGSRLAELRGRTELRALRGQRIDDDGA